MHQPTVSRLNFALLFGTRTLRMFAYGFLSVILALYLAELGLNDAQIGVLFSFTLAGDAALSLWLTANADRLGRRRMLFVGALLMLMAGVVFAITQNPIALTLAAVIGVISPSGSEIGPFLAIEQAALTQLISDDKRTQVFAWYNLVGSFATAAGALVCGLVTQTMRNAGIPLLAEYRAIVIGYALMGGLLALLFTRMTQDVEVLPAQQKAMVNRFGLHQSKNIVAKLSAFFALDAFGGALVLQSFLAYWFALKFQVQPAVLGSIFFGANILAGISALLASRIAARVGLINTMVFTHIPSNLLLMLVPFMPTLPLAIALLLARYSISQMDVPTRQSYVMAVVSADERSAAAGVTGIARSVGSALAPSLTGLMLRAGGVWLNAPFVIAGTLKIIYDVLLWRSFSAVKPPEENM